MVNERPFNLGSKRCAKRVDKKGDDQIITHHQGLYGSMVLGCNHLGLSSGMSTIDTRM